MGRDSSGFNPGVPALFFTESTVISKTSANGSFAQQPLEWERQPRGYVPISKARRLQAEPAMLPSRSRSMAFRRVCTEATRGSRRGPPPHRRRRQAPSQGARGPERPCIHLPYRRSERTGRVLLAPMPPHARRREQRPACPGPPSSASKGSPRENTTPPHSCSTRCLLSRKRLYAPSQIGSGNRTAKTVPARNQRLPRRHSLSQVCVAKTRPTHRGRNRSGAPSTGRWIRAAGTDRSQRGVSARNGLTDSARR